MAAIFFKRVWSIPTEASCLLRKLRALDAVDHWWDTHDDNVQSGMYVIILSKSRSACSGRITISWPHGRLGLRNNLQVNRITSVKLDPATRGEHSPDRFATTRWSVVLSCADSKTGNETARKALSELCKTYWRPIFAFICRRGYSIPDAQDLTQDFFIMVLEGSLLQRADPTRGRFRSLLLKAVQNFLIDSAAKKHARKRGGDMKFVSWDEWMTEAPSQLSISGYAAEHWSAEKIYDVRWAATVVEHALRQVGEEFENKGRRRVFDVLSSYLEADRQDVSYTSLSKTLGIPQAGVKRLVHQMRQRYRALLREQVAQTVENPDDVDEELRYLCAALVAAE